jgi:hypothetical protein
LKDLIRSGGFMRFGALALGSTGAARALSLVFFLSLLSLGGCQTNEAYRAAQENELSARLEGYTGVTIADFIARTGMTPTDAYPVSQGKVFIFRTDPVYVTLPATNLTPAITRSSRCQLLIRAVNRAGTAGADQWIIEGTERSGNCNRLQV